MFLLVWQILHLLSSQVSIMCLKILILLRIHPHLKYNYIIPPLLPAPLRIPYHIFLPTYVLFSELIECSQCCLQCMGVGLSIGAWGTNLPGSAFLNKINSSWVAASSCQCSSARTVALWVPSHLCWNVDWFDLM